MDVKMNVIVLVALKEETPTLQSEPNVFFTGVGKINAAHVATKVILEHKPNLVINYGTAGAIDTPLKGKLVEVSKFVQRDMDCGPLGFEKYVTPYEESSLYIGEGNLICGSGDSFVTDKHSNGGANIVDMEAYALAKVCGELGVSFRCFKYMSDEADENASSDWKEFASMGEHLFLERLDEEKLSWM